MSWRRSCRTKYERKSPLFSCNAYKGNKSLLRQINWVTVKCLLLFLAEFCERSPRDEMTYRSLICNGSQKIKKTVLSTTAAELYSFMKCFGSCQFLRGLWMDISGEVVNIHMRTDAKNLVTAARTIHLPELKETIHMISMLRKEASSRGIHDLAHIPTHNFLAD